MNNKIAKTIGVTGFALILTSCGDASGDLVNVPNVAPSTAVTKVLKKLTVTPTVSPSFVETFNYTSGKLSTVASTQYNYDYSLQYAANNIAKITAMQSGSQREIHNFTYSGANISAISGNVHPDATYQASVTYTAGKITLINADFSTLGIPGIDGNRKIEIEYSGENVSKAVLTIQYFNVPSVIVKTAVFSNFDSNPNPMRTLPASYIIARALLSDDPKTVSAFSVNNYRAVTEQTGGTVQSENVVHTYDAQTYPSQSVSPSVTKLYDYLTI